MVYTECCSHSCPTGDRCTNQRMQRKEWVDKLEKFMTADRGYGVKATLDIQNGKFIIEYCGEVVSENEFRRRMSEEYNEERHHYCLNLDGNVVIDGYRVGNISRFINHSCQPNCQMEKWNVNGIYRIGLFAIKDIPPNTELTYDYNFHSYNSLAQQLCKCGSDNCRGVMGEKNQRINIATNNNNNKGLDKNGNNTYNTRLRPKMNQKSKRRVPGYLKSSLSTKLETTSSLPRPSSFSSSSSSSSSVSSSMKQPAMTNRASSLRNHSKDNITTSVCNNADLPSFNSTDNTTTYSNNTHISIITNGTINLSNQEKSLIIDKSVFLIRNYKRVYNKKYIKNMKKTKYNTNSINTTTKNNSTNNTNNNSNSNNMNNNKSLKNNRTRTNNELREALRLKQQLTMKKQQLTTKKHYGSFCTKLPGFKDMFDLKPKLAKKNQLKVNLADSLANSSTNDVQASSIIPNEIKTISLPTNQIKARSPFFTEGQDQSSLKDQNLKYIFANVICIMRDALEVPTYLQHHPALQLLKVKSTIPCKAAHDKPPDLQAIYHNIQLNHYDCFQSFNIHIIMLFANIQEKIGYNCEVEELVGVMKSVYRDASKEAICLYKEELEKYGLLKERRMEDKSVRKSLGKKDVVKVGVRIDVEKDGIGKDVEKDVVRNGMGRKVKEHFDSTLGGVNGEGIMDGKKDEEILMKEQSKKEIMERNGYEIRGDKDWVNERVVVEGDQPNEVINKVTKSLDGVDEGRNRCRVEEIGDGFRGASRLAVDVCAGGEIVNMVDGEKSDFKNVLDDNHKIIDSIVFSKDSLNSFGSTHNANSNKKDDPGLHNKNCSDKEQVHNESCNETIADSIISSRDGEEEEEVIRCVCNIYKDEGLMVQCEKCETWQHCMCMNVKGDEDHYMCELCEPREVNKEVLLVPQPDDALLHCRYYLTLVRSGGVQVRVADCVYVSREGSNITSHDLHVHPELKDQLDIFRIERLWRKYNGEGCVFGHYYVRPQETFHEPHRRFFPNELFRAPIFHVVPLEAVVASCCVLDLPSFCLGRPKDRAARDMYICEYRVDKTARLFSKMSKSRHHTNKASYCFDRHPHKLKPRRTLTAHELSSTTKTTEIS